MQVVVKIRPEFLVNDETRHVLKASHELTEISAEFGVSIHPIHPGVPIPQLASYFAAEVADRNTADQLVSRLHAAGVVDAAYVKPADEPA